jgi:hypothetical protein
METSPDLFVLWSRIGLVALAVVIALVPKWIDTLRMAWLLRNVPSPTGASFIGGHISALTDPKTHRIIQRWSDQYGGFFKIRAYWWQVGYFVITHSCIGLPGYKVGDLAKGLVC